MPTYIIERDIPGAETLSADELREIATKSNDVVARMGVPYTWLTSYVAGDKFYCIHEAPSSDDIERHARDGGFPANKVTEVASIIGPQTATSAL